MTGWAMVCTTCERRFTDGIDAGRHEIEASHVVTWDDPTDVLSARCNGKACDGRETVDEFCYRHGQVGRELWAAEQFATHDPDVDWPSPNHASAVAAIMAALDRVRDAA